MDVLNVKVDQEAVVEFKDQLTFTSFQERASTLFLACMKEPWVHYSWIQKWCIHWTV
jgi:hypothetical protein